MIGTAVAAGLIVVLAVIHSVLGERYILRRLDRRPQPVLFGDDTFTKQTLRFVWHALTLAWFALAALLVWPGGATVGWIVAGTLTATALLTIVVSRGRHLSWLVELAAVAGLLVDLL